MAALLRSLGSASVLGAGIGAVVGLIAPYGYSYGLEYHFGVSLDLKRWVSFSRSCSNGGIGKDWFVARTVAAIIIVALQESTITFIVPGA